MLSLPLTGCQRSQVDDDIDVSVEETESTVEYNVGNISEPLPTESPTDNPGQDDSEDEPALPNVEAIRVTADTVNIRKESTVSSEVITQAKRNDVFQLLDEKVDADNRTWYLVEFDFGCKGWIPGWLCEKTDDWPRVRKSNKGSLLNPAIDEDIYVRALLLEEYTRESFEKAFGKNYTEEARYVYKKYKYPSGLYFEINRENELAFFGVEEPMSGKIYPDTITRKTCDIFSEPGDELLIFFECSLYYRLLVCRADTGDLLREYTLGYLNLDNIEIGDFLNNGSQQIYLEGNIDGYPKKGLYRVVDDDFVEVFNINSFDQYADHVQASLDGNSFSMSVRIGNYQKSFTSILPDKVFYDTTDVKDKNGLLTIESDWDVVRKNNRWLIQVCCKVNYPMIYYYWGPPGDDNEPNEILYNDLARVFVDLSMNGTRQEISDVRAEVKYDNPELLKVEPLGYDEIRLVDGPSVEMTMEEAYQALGGSMENFRYAEHMEYNGVSLFEFCGLIVDITVTTPDYETPRGLRVGDPIEKVERLYGKPDYGFSGDGYVSYKCTYPELGFVNYYRGLDIGYKDGVVKWFTLYQVILD